MQHSLPSGGAKRTTYEHVRGLSSRHEISVFEVGVHDKDWCDLQPYATEYIGVDFRPFQTLSRPFGQLNDAIRIADVLRLGALSKRLAGQINAGCFDAVLVRRCHYTWTPWILQYLQRPAVYYCEDPNRLVHEAAPDRPYYRESRIGAAVQQVNPATRVYRQLLRAIERRGLKAADRVLVNSDYVRHSLRELYGVTAHTVYHGVDVEAFPALGHPRSHMVLSVGALNPFKGFDFAVRVLGCIAQTLRPRLVIVSNNHDSRELIYIERLAAESHVDIDVRFQVTHTELVELYNRALFTLYTPYREPFGLVPLESMACGTPVVGIAEAGVLETVVDGETGHLLSRDVETAAAIVTEILAAPVALADMGRRARKYVTEHWSWGRSVANLESHIYAVSRGVAKRHPK